MFHNDYVFFFLRDFIFYDQNMKTKINGNNVFDNVTRGSYHNDPTFKRLPNSCMAIQEADGGIEN